MFRIHSLEINGFKSFVDPVRTEFAEGITAIVGPNGCGKSNLSEAITWVLGEQSAKTLRGGRMEDVIFAGTDRRAPLGMAEVSLTMLAPDFEQAEDGKLTIGRRVFRSGESVYRLNNRVVRLKDIRDLLMDTGLGIRAYSVIEQGKIGQILSGKPQERRKLIEEAAGITRYRQRKRLAELKLEEATANRMRLDDIVAEVERALRALKRQASAARRYQEREREHRALQRRLLVAKSLLAQRKLRRLHDALAERVDHDAALASRLAAAEAELVAARTRLDELQDQSSSWYRRTAELDTRIESLAQRIQGARRTREEVAERLASGSATAERRSLERDTHAASLADLAAQREGLVASRDEADRSFGESRERVAGAAGHLAEREQTVERQRADLMTSLGRVNEQQSRLHRSQIEGERAAFRRERLDQEIAAKDEEQRDGHRDLQHAQHRIEELERAVATQRADLERHRGELDALLRREGEATKRRQRAEEDARALEHRRGLLEELAAADDERRAAVRAALEELELADAPFLEHLAQAPEGWEESVDLYLASMRDAVVLPADADPLELATRNDGASSELRLVLPSDREAALDLYAQDVEARWRASERRRARAAKQRESARRTEIEAAARRAAEPAAALEPAVVATAEAPRLSLWQRIKRVLFGSPSATSSQSDVASAEPVAADLHELAAPAELADIDVSAVTDETDELAELDTDASASLPQLRPLGTALGLPDAIARALPPAYLVETAAQAHELARQHPGVAFLARGGVVGHSGLLVLRGSGARPGALSRARELHALGEREHELRHIALSAAAELEVLVEDRTALAAASRQAEARLAELQKEHAVAQARRQDAANRLEQLERERAELDEERRSLAADAERIASDHALRQHDLEAARAQHAELEQRLDAAQADADRARAEHEKLRAEDAVQAERLRLLEERLAAHAAEVARLERQSHAVVEFLAHWERERAQLDHRREELTAEIDAAEREQQQALEERFEVEEQRRLAAERLEEHRAAARELEAQVRAVRAEREEQRAELERLRIEQAEQRSAAEHVAEAYWAKFHGAVPLLDATLAPTAAARIATAAITAVPAASGEALTSLATASDARPAPERDEPELAPTSAAVTAVDAEVGVAVSGFVLPRTHAARAEAHGPAAEVVDPAALLAAAEQDIERIPALEAETRALEEALERIGPVNVLAAEEHTQQEERHTFLVEQRSDLMRSIESLRRTIREINETSHERFTATFEAVNESFARVFSELFRGGEATMRLLDDEDPLESGIEIVARPPGKRLQNLQLLSGGEKALTAIALLFALFLTKPSPFCILDEVDAPLDDANVMRFVEMLERMSKDTQFLVITHNKLTMEAASTLYGVTMQEKGVSKLVAVDLDQLHPADRMAS